MKGIDVETQDKGIWTQTDEEYIWLKAKDKHNDIQQTKKQYKARRNMMTESYIIIVLNPCQYGKY